MNEIINFLLEQFTLPRKRDECWAGLKPASHAVWASAFTFRPPALYALSLPLTLIEELNCLIHDLDIGACALHVKYLGSILAV